MKDIKEAKAKLLNDQIAQQLIREQPLPSQSKIPSIKFILTAKSGFVSKNDLAYRTFNLAGSRGPPNPKNPTQNQGHHFKGLVEKQYAINNVNFRNFAHKPCSPSDGHLHSHRSLRGAPKHWTKRYKDLYNNSDRKIYLFKEKGTSRG
jgi:hypothetical protein